MTRTWLNTLLGVTMGLLLALPTQAQSKRLGPWQVHYSAFGSTFLAPEVARQYQVSRSRYNAVINISVLDERGEPLAVAITGEARELTGTVRTLSFYEVREGKAIYYLAQLPYRNEETYRFNLTLMGAGQQQTLDFQQTFYVDP